RLKRRKDEYEMMTGKSSKLDSDPPKSMEDYFRELHKKKDEEAQRGEDLHQGSEEASQASREDDDFDSDEEYENLMPVDDIDPNDKTALAKLRLEKPIKKAHRPGYDLVHQIVLRLQHWMNVGELAVRV